MPMRSILFLSKPNFPEGPFGCPGPDRYWGYSITLPSRFQIKLDIKSAVYDITAAWIPNLVFLLPK